MTLREAPQIFVTVRVAVDGGGEAEGMAAEMLAPKWFDKNPDLSNEDNFQQLRDALVAIQSAVSEPALYTLVADTHGGVLQGFQRCILAL